MSFILVEQLNILGFTEEYRRLTLYVFGIIFVYFLVNKGVIFLIKKQLFIILSYIVTSMLLLLVVSFIAVIQFDPLRIKQMFQALSLFGILLVAFHLLRMIRRAIFANK